jgi:hypothetical protein
MMEMRRNPSMPRSMILTYSIVIQKMELRL